MKRGREEDENTEELRMRAMTMLRKGECKEGLKMMRKAARRKNGEACWMMGKINNCRLFGTNSTRKDTIKSYFKKAADLGNGKGMLEYSFWMGDESRLVWQKKAFDTDDISVLIFCHLYGKVVPINHEIAFELSRKHELDMFIQFDLAQRQEYGIIKMDPIEKKAMAIEWYTKSAEQGYIRAQIRLGDMFIEKHINDKPNPLFNRTKAWYWYKKANKYRKVKGTFSLACFENFEQYDRVRKSVFALIAYRQFQKQNCGHLKHLPLDIIKIIATHLWSTRLDQSWNI
jgi:TPR repeat protein